MSKKSSLSSLLELIAHDNSLPILQAKRLLRIIHRKIFRWKIFKQVVKVWKNIQIRVRHLH